MRASLGRRLVGALGVTALTALGLTAVSLTVGAAPAGAAPTTLTLIIEQIVEIDDPEDGFGEGDCWGDYVFDVNFGGSTSTSPEFSIDPGFGTGCIISHPETITIGYAVTRTFDTSQVGIPLTIEVTDVDTFNDDTIDVSPVPGEKILRLSVDPFLGGFSIIDSSGDSVSGVSFPGGVTSATIEGDGDDDRGGLNIRIVSPGANDADGDGLLDAWETGGFDADGDGTVDVDLPAMGADPDRKDLFLELDTANGQTLGRDDIQAMKNAFAAAPLPNPDGSTGVSMWVDTGGAVDSGAREGQVLGTCSDGADNSGDGTADGADPDCAGLIGGGSPYLDASVEDPLPGNCANGVDDDGDGLGDGDDPDCVVGDDLGGGNAVAGSPPICNLDTDFYATKAANFDADRLPVFRYAISTPAASCSSGGQAEIGGNDFVDHNGDGGTIMHELGHTLTLRHGGFEDDNCKPNHVSVMSYFSQFGIGRVGGGVLLDYAPVRRSILSGPRSTALPGTVLNEAALSETTPLDATDAVNRFVFTDGLGDTAWSDVGGQVDWNGVNGIEAGPIAAVNINTSDATSGRPSACTNAGTADVLEGADEWSQVSLPFRQFGDSANAPRNPTTIDEPTVQEQDDLIDTLTTTDVALSVTDAPDPVAAGAEVTFTATATNLGQAPADAAQLVLTTDPRLSPASLPAGCAEIGTEVRCELGTIEAGTSAVVAVPYLVDADAVHVAGGPFSVSTDVAVTHAGDDPVPGNDAETEQTQVIAVADLRVDDAAVTDAPPILVLGATSPFTISADVANGGPSSPMDAEVTFSATGSGVTAVPTTEAVDALAAGAPRTVSGVVDVTCDEPGLRTLTFTAAISPAPGAGSDPVATNDAQTRTVTVDCAVPVAIDVEPGHADDELPISSRGNAFIGVFTTVAGEYGLPIDVDATSVLADTVRLGVDTDLFAGGGIAPRFADTHDLRELGPAEHGRDGDLDLRLRFVRQEVPLDPTDTEVCVLGRLIAPDGTELTFFGCTDVRVVELGSG